MKHVRYRSTLVVIGLASGLLVGCESQENPPPAPPVVRGLADFHNHQFSDLAFGGQLLTHGVAPGGACRAPLPYDGNSFAVKDIVRTGLVGQAAEQAKTGGCFPTATNLAGQQMDTDSLKRAWEYGLRLMVMLAVNSEFLCKAGDFSPPTCNDRRAIDAQLTAAHDLERSIDEQSGAPGTGWYRIVESPAEARQVVSDGKLAVVLGVEAANAFGGCNLQNAPPPVEGIPNLIGSKPPEGRWRITCNPPLVQALGASQAIARFEHYWNLGARHFFLVHNVEGVAGGNSVSNPLLHGIDNPSRLAQGGAFNRVPDLDRVVSEIRPQLERWNCSTLDGAGRPRPFEFDGGRCNKLGLTDTGQKLARAVSDAGAVIDIDHLSFKAKQNLRNNDTGIGDYYPVVSSHSGFAEINHGDKSNEDQLTPQMLKELVRWGGAFGPILRQADAPEEVDTYPPDASVAKHVCGGTTETWVQAYRYLVDTLKATPLNSGKPAFVGVGYGSDFNGLAGWPAGRFDTAQSAVGETSPKRLFVGGSRSRSPGRCYLALGGFPSEPAHVTYPFTSPLTGASFERSVLPWSGRAEPYDISSDGVAHTGMIPDFVEEMRTLGITDDELEPLWQGAEAYIRTWETAAHWGDSITWEQDADRETCRTLRTQLVPDDLPQFALQLRDELRAARCFGLP